MYSSASTNHFSFVDSSASSSSYIPWYRLRYRLNRASASASISLFMTSFEVSQRKKTRTVSPTQVKHRLIKGRKGRDESAFSPLSTRRRPEGYRTLRGR